MLEEIKINSRTVRYTWEFLLDYWIEKYMQRNTLGYTAGSITTTLIKASLRFEQKNGIKVGFIYYEDVKAALEANKKLKPIDHKNGSRYYIRG
jgi:hypothetical protein